MSTTANTIETNGWDTVYAVPFSLINTAIVNKSSSPASFSESETNDDGTTSFAGTFGHWQLATGGDGQLVMMSLPIPTATFTLGTINRNLTNGTATIQLNLIWVDDPADPKYQNLIINNDSNTVQVIDITFAESVSAAEKGIMIQFLHNWLGKNADDFQHIFSTVNINDVANTGSFQWLMPTDVSYAVKDATPANLNTSVFGILCMTENRTAPGTSQVPANALSASANSALLISPERVIAKMFFPNIYGIFKDATLADFEIGNTKLYIQNKNALTFEPQTMDDGTSKTLSLAPNEFRLEIQDTRITMTLNKISYEYKSGLDVNFNHSADATFNIVKGVFNLAVTGSNTDVNVEESTGVIIGEIAAGLAAAIIGAIIGGIIGGALSGGADATANAAAEIVEEGATSVEMTATDSTQSASQGSNIAPAVVDEVLDNAPGRFSTFFAKNWAKLLGGFVGILIGGPVTPGIMFGLQALAKGSVPPLTDFGANAIQSITWPTTNNQEFQIVNGTLNGALQIGINLTTTNP
jgi:Clostridium P-47 protein